MPVGTGIDLKEIRWSELDLDNAMWTILGRRTKNGSTHVVPLSLLAMQIIRSVPRYLNSDFVFTTTGRTAISGFGRLKDRLDGAYGPQLSREVEVVVPGGGIEPPTRGFSIRCSTN